MNTENAGLTSWEYPRLSGIKIQEITNRTRNKSFGKSYVIRIPARVNGGRKVRYQRQNKQEAFTLAEKTYRAYQREGSFFSDLSDEEKKIASLAIKMAKESDLSLLNMTEFAKKRMRPASQIVRFKDVVSELQEIKLKCDLKEVTIRDFRSRSNRLCEYMGEINILEIEKSHIANALSSMKNVVTGEPLTKRSVKNYRMVLAEVFRLALCRKYILENPLDEFDQQERKMLWGADKANRHKEPVILELEEAQTLLFTALKYPELELLGSIVLGLFCGLRTEEAKEVEWSLLHIDDEDEPFLEIPKGLGKGRYIRNVPLPPIALIWLSLCEKKYDKISYPQQTKYTTYSYRFKKLCMKAGIENWNRDKSNAIRHSYGTYLYNLTGSTETVMSNMGHQNDKILFEHYRALTSKRDAKNFFKLGLDEIDLLREHVKDKKLWNLGISLLNKPKPILHYSSVDLDEGGLRLVA